MADIFGSKFFFLTHLIFFHQKSKKNIIFWYSIFVKKIRFTGGNSILNSMVETISSFRPVSKKRPETVWNCQSFTETGWKKKGLFGIKPGKRTVSSYSVLTRFGKRTRLRTRLVYFIKKVLSVGLLGWEKVLGFFHRWFFFNG